MASQIKRFERQDIPKWGDARIDEARGKSYLHPPYFEQNKHYEMNRYSGADPSQHHGRH